MHTDGALMLTKDQIMDYIPYMIMGCSVIMLLLTVQDIINKW